MQFHGRFLFIFLIYFLAVSFELVATSSVLAQQTEEQEQTASSEVPAKPQNFTLNPMTFLVKTMGYITLISLFVYLGLKIYKRLVYTGGSSQSPKIRVLGSSIIGPKKSLCIVDALGHFLLLGVTENQISLLLELPEGELNEDIKSSLLQTKTQTNPEFHKILSHWVKK